MAELENFADLCRTCGTITQPSSRHAIFEGEGPQRRIHEHLKVLPVPVAPDDHLPQVLCLPCLEKINSVNSFFDKVRHTDKLMRNILARQPSVSIKIEPDINALLGEMRQNSMESAPEFAPEEPINSAASDSSESSEDDVPLRLRKHKKPAKSKKVEKTVKKSTQLKYKKSNIDSDRPKRPKAKNGQGKRRMKSTREKLPFPFHPCWECYLVFATREALLEHTRSHKRVFPCRRCSMKFRTKALLDEHVAGGAHLARGVKYHPWRCKECGKEYELTYKMKTHMRVHSEERLFQCASCMKYFKTREALKVHTKTIHADGFNFVCNYCGKGFLLKPALNSHILINHSNCEKPLYNCNECGKGFYTKLSIKNHVSRHFIKSPPIICDLCGKCVSSKPSLWVHKKMHTMTLEERKKYVCVVCGDRFTTNSALKHHLGAHNIDNVPERRIHECHLCGKKMLSAYSLKKHLELHTGIKPFVCELCGKAFAVNSTLRGHMRIHLGERPYECHVCHSTFTQRPSLLLHLRKIHDIDGRIRTFPKNNY